MKNSNTAPFNEEKDPLIHVVDLKKNFKGLHALNGVSLDIYKGEVVFIVGPSGSGKSTFLRCLNRLEEPSGGEVGRRRGLPSARRRNGSTTRSLSNASTRPSSRSTLQRQALSRCFPSARKDAKWSLQFGFRRLTHRRMSWCSTESPSRTRFIQRAMRYTRPTARRSRRSLRLG